MGVRVFRGRHALVGVVGLVGMVGFSACGGGGSGSSAATPSTTSTTNPAKSLGTTDLQALDYSGAIPELSDVEFYGGPYHAIDSSGIADLADTNLRKQCGSSERSPVHAVAGTGQEIRDAGETAGLTTTVQAFATAEAAETAMKYEEAKAKACTAYTSSSGDSFRRVSSPLRDDGGDQSFSMFARDVKTGFLVADHFVRRGPFVYDIRYAVSGTNALVGSPGALREIARVFDDRFLSWAKGQLAAA